MSDYNHELIDRYLEGELSGEELSAFEQQLQQDPALAEEVALYKKINEEMQRQAAIGKDTQQLAGHLSDLNKEFFGKEIPVRQINTINRWWYAVAGVAAAVLLFLLWNPFGRQESFDNEKLFAYYTRDTEDLPGSERGNNSDSLRLKAATLYNNGDFKNALPLLETLATTRPEDLQVQMALANSLVQENRYAEAMLILEKTEAGNSVYQTEATWFKALALLKQNNTAACYRVLQTIKETSSRYKQAAELMKKIDKAGKR